MWTTVKYKIYDYHYYNMMLKFKKYMDVKTLSCFLVNLYYKYNANET